MSTSTGREARSTQARVKRKFAGLGRRVPGDPLTHVCDECLPPAEVAVSWCSVPMRCRVCRRTRNDVLVVRESTVKRLRGSSSKSRAPSG